VINVLMNKDSIIYVRLTLSGKIYSTNNFFELKDAEVQLYDNDQLIETLILRKVGNYDYYCSTTKVQAGHTYRVKVKPVWIDGAEGADVVPDSVVIGELKRIEARINDTDVDNKVILQIHDKAGERNYYRIRIFGAFKGQQSNGQPVIAKYGQPAGIKSEDPSIDFLGEGENNEIFMDDRLFDGRSPRFIFNLESQSTVEYLIVEVSALSYDSYRYLKTSYSAARKADNPFTEKVLVFNNIKNGMGIVGGVALREYILQR
jgi:hypothetical protein